MTALNTPAVVAEFAKQLEAFRVSAGIDVPAEADVKVMDPTTFTTLFNAKLQDKKVTNTATDFTDNFDGFALADAKTFGDFKCVAPFDTSKTIKLNAKKATAPTDPMVVSDPTGAQCTRTSDGYLTQLNAALATKNMEVKDEKTLTAKLDGKTFNDDAIRCAKGYKATGTEKIKFSKVAAKAEDSAYEAVDLKCAAESADAAVARIQADAHFKDVTTLTKKDEKTIEISCKDDKHKFKDANKDKVKIERADATKPFELSDFSKLATCEKKTEGGDSSSAVKAGACLFVSAVAGLLWTVL